MKGTLTMYHLIKVENNITKIHGVFDRVSEAIDFYYRFRRQFGYMEVVDTSDNNKVLATLSSK